MCKLVIIFISTSIAKLTRTAKRSRKHSRNTCVQRCACSDIPSRYKKLYGYNTCARARTYSIHLHVKERESRKLCQNLINFTRSCSCRLTKLRHFVLRGRINGVGIDMICFEWTLLRQAGRCNRDVRGYSRLRLHLGADEHSVLAGCQDLAHDRALSATLIGSN